MASLRRWVPTSSRFNQNCRVAICVWLSSPSLWSPAAASAASTASMGTTNSPFATCSGAVRGTACLGPNRSSRDGTRRQTLFALVSEPNEAREDFLREQHRPKSCFRSKCLFHARYRGKEPTASWRPPAEPGHRWAGRLGLPQGRCLTASLTARSALQLRSGRCGASSGRGRRTGSRGHEESL